MKSQAYEIKEADITCEDARYLLDLLNKSLLDITGNSGVGSFHEQDVADHNGVFLIGYCGKQPIACGALRKLSTDTGEIKRVYALKNDFGAAHKMVDALEAYASKEGFQNICLETRVVNQHAVQFYYSCGYQKCDNYGKYVGCDEAICFNKLLKYHHE